MALAADHLLMDDGGVRDLAFRSLRRSPGRQIRIANCLRFVRRFLGRSRRSSVSPESHGDIAGTVITHSDDSTPDSLRPLETSEVSGRSRQRCPYCVHEGQFRSMRVGTNGKYVCDNCGYIAVLTDPAFKCDFRKCLELRKSFPAGPRENRMNQVAAGNNQ